MNLECAQQAVLALVFFLSLVFSLAVVGRVLLARRPGAPDRKPAARSAGAEAPRALVPRPPPQDGKTLGDQTAEWMQSLSNPLIETLQSMPIPVVAAVNGAAAGAGRAAARG